MRNGLNFGWNPAGLEAKKKRKAKDRIPDELLKEIFPKKLARGLSAGQIYSHLKKVIISGKLKKGQKLLKERPAQDFRARGVTVGIAFSQLKKDGLILFGSFLLSGRMPIK